MFDVHVASRNTCLEILSEPRLLRVLHLSALELPTHLEESPNTFYEIQHKKYKMLFTLEDKGRGMYEVHIACPSYSIIASRVLALGLLDWAFKREDADVQAIVTTCPEGKIANMCRKIGMSEVGKTLDKICFMITNPRLGG